MVGNNDKVAARKRRQMRVRRKIQGTPERPRLSVFCSDKHMYAQLICDVTGCTLAASSTLAADVREEGKFLGNIAGAKKVGAAIAKLALSRNISKVVFDRNGYLYHGKVKALADSAREAGLEF